MSAVATRPTTSWRSSLAVALMVAFASMVAAASANADDQTADLGTARKEFVRAHGDSAPAPAPGLSRQSGCPYFIGDTEPRDTPTLDIIRYSVNGTCDSLVFEVITNDPWNYDAMDEFAIEFDRDADATTGCNGVDTVAFAFYEPSEQLVYFGAFASPTCDSATWQDRGPVTLFANHLYHIGLDVPTTAFREGIVPMPEFFRYRITLSSQAGGMDVAPNFGSGFEYSDPKPPIGSWELAQSPTPEAVQVAGWAADLTPLTITSNHARVDVHLDGQHLGQYGANGIRDDVATAFPLLGRYVGFDHTIQVGAWGDHEVCLDLLHAQDAGLVTSLGCRTLYIAPVAPLGNLEALTSADEQIVVEGWAGHPDGTPGATVTIRVDGALAGG